MKIRISKREMATLLDAMLLKSAVQEAEIEAALDTIADGEESVRKGVTPFSVFIYSILIG